MNKSEKWDDFFQERVVKSTAEEASRLRGDERAYGETFRQKNGKKDRILNLVLN